MFAPAIEETRPESPNLLVRIHLPAGKPTLLIDEFDSWSIALSDDAAYCICGLCCSPDTLNPYFGNGS